MAGVTTSSTSTNGASPARAGGRRPRPSATRPGSSRLPRRGGRQLAGLFVGERRRHLRVGRSSARRTETRIPSSSISTSPTPLSWTIRTISLIRCSRDSSSVVSPRSSRVWRARIVCRSASASSPKSAIRTSSSSLAKPSASCRTSSAVGGSSSAAPRRRRAARLLAPRCRRPSRVGCRTRPGRASGTRPRRP